MLHWSRKRLRSASTVLAAVFAGLLLMGTCAAASAACDSPCTESGISPELTMPCAQAVTACDLPALDAPIAHAFDFSITPVVLTTLPLDLVATDAARAPPRSWQSTRPPSTPLYLTHLALLN